MALTFTRRCTRKVELVLSIYCKVLKWHEAARTFGLFDFVKGTAAKKSSMYGEYGSFEN